jgi:hypothetical protein
MNSEPYPPDDQSFYPDVSSALIAGAVAWALGQPRVPPDCFDDDEHADWLKGYDGGVS